MMYSAPRVILDLRCSCMMCDYKVNWTLPQSELPK